MLCLGIESSCDETAMALVRDGVLLGERIASQVDMHAVFGGVVPELASREHLRWLYPLLDELLQEAGLAVSAIECVAVSRGPGLLGSLLVGLGFAKGFAYGRGIPLVGVNHLPAHLLVAGLEHKLVFPAIGLLVSGGHTHLYHMRSPVEVELIGRTLDDAAGEAFDKVAKLLNFPYPGGKHIDRLGKGTPPDHNLFPRPYLHNDNLDFSFSGLKTAVLQYVHKHAELVMPSMDAVLQPGFEPSTAMACLCSSFNWTVAETLRVKTERALDRYPDVRGLYVAGGAAANSVVRKVMEDVAARRNKTLLLPSPSLCTDNGAMIAFYGEILANAGLFHGLDLEAVPRGKPIPWDYGC
ncbi:tRNA (adenosine(37)-N6)-threonylcarbamoyltransferase complex transferase subunit TsaD [Desulfoplanes formicivorans]|uniref:tRNA N6-adenosine threonylcarbamoyltransferase n=1 Tax=Desulfoplanes formicivorans TaxID=1592317 RepID=A0A194AFK2_9BACT|nr:tRNA (adenosine(37)-N6)-threonylcarbamoyltransferase complex transferase subunit TsaD [Desulfoplanes formicivorans]GAU07866.1 tRNA threonylcarbamoyladenosine modification protein TsaD [Desulfoplanes formicivorans]